jgi:hydroxyethylthiazole kinase
MNADEIVAILAAVRERKPMIHNITNFVVMNFTANALLAVGAAPVMAHALEEVEEMTAQADALVINIGTLSNVWVEAMFRAARVAREAGKPVILDPVGAGATRFRTETSRRLIDERLVSVVRGNASEILAISGLESRNRGVDAADATRDVEEAAITLARRNRITVSMTGPEDLVTNGEELRGICNGHPMMARVTGSGCVASALTGAFCAVEKDFLKAGAAALAVWGIAGEWAARSNPRPGTYQTLLVDALDEVDAEIIRGRAQIGSSVCIM